jgi:AbiV family abortive infection protein
VKEEVSQYKLTKIAIESLRNALRLHFDSVCLFNNGSFPSAFQLSVLSLEEFAKAKLVENYIWSCITNGHYPDEEFEQEWLQLLYRHPEKQIAFIAGEIFNYSPKFAEFVKRRKLEEKKQNATYVGLARLKGKVDTSSRVSTPKRIGEKHTSQLISLLNHEFLEVFRLIDSQGFCFDIPEMDKLIDKRTYNKLKKWPYKTGLKSNRWSKNMAFSIGG